MGSKDQGAASAGAGSIHDNQMGVLFIYGANLF